MDFLYNITEEVLLISPTKMKSKILDRINEVGKLLNIKIMSFEEIKKHIYFDYDDEAILYLMNKYNYIYENAKMLIENMYFIADVNYDIDKINDLVRLKKELIDLNLLTIDTLFYNKYSKKKIMVFGYDFISKFNIRILNKFENVSIVENEIENISSRRVYKFKSIDDEVSFVIRAILDLLYEEIPLNKIKILNSNSDYEKALRRISSFYKLPIFFENKNSIYGTKMVDDYIKSLEYSDFNSALEGIRNDYDLNIEGNNYIFNKILNVSNKYSGINYNKKLIIDAIKCEFKSINNRKIQYAKGIEVVDLKDNYFNMDEHLFLLGFNQGEVPISHKDEDYFSDFQKEKLGIDTSVDLNSFERNSVMRILTTYPNLIITYKERSGKEECYPSYIIEEQKYEVVDCQYDNTITYSKEYDKFKYSVMLDNLIRFGIKDDNLELYFNNYEIPYLEYDNKFTGISKTSVINKIKNRLVLSYSSIDNFYRCSFRYYVGNILKLNKYEETFPIFVGKLFHDILSHSMDDGFDFEFEYENYVNKRECSQKELFFLSKLKTELEIIINRLKDLYEKTKLNNILSEKTIHIDKSINNIEVDFMGVIDKIMYKEIDGNTLIAIIDYKTGNLNINLFNVIYGIEMQLIIYMYLVSKSKLFESIKFVGIYLQKILSSEVTINKNKSYKELKNDNLKLQGYSINNESLISSFDPTYCDSEFIKSMKITSNGFSSYTKLLNTEDVDALINLVDKKIIGARDNILDGLFDINPKQIGSDNVGCKFCEYRDICYLKASDVVKLKEYDDLSFLGGDINA